MSKMPYTAKPDIEIKGCQLLQYLEMVLFMHAVHLVVSDKQDKVEQVLILEICNIDVTCVAAGYTRSQSRIQLRTWLVITQEW